MHRTHPHPNNNKKFLVVYLTLHSYNISYEFMPYLNKVITKTKDYFKSFLTYFNPTNYLLVMSDFIN